MPAPCSRRNDAGSGYATTLNHSELGFVHVVVAAHAVRAGGAGTDDDCASYVEDGCRQDTTDASATGSGCC